jgi:hypothetical protein
VGYFSTGRFSLLFENALYAAAGSGLPLMFRCIEVWWYYSVTWRGLLLAVLF